MYPPKKGPAFKLTVDKDSKSNSGGRRNALLELKVIESVFGILGDDIMREKERDESVARIAEKIEAGAINTVRMETV
ncbi:hypothetical protein CHS0354_036281 [Potamilus streckersoni]|uniref:Uncharacterized protein n=1 Tax=Potamilus streckersoni TaxID=2493646 RepID=A0AAE0T737_9BIVA|nr:hypothetical protein CHS0354_036281 [Potamilus streckersoni]